MSRSWFWGAVALLWVGCAAVPAPSTSPVIDRIRETGELRVGMAGDYPPLNALDRGGESFGLEPELARAMAKSLSVELVIVNRPFSELLAALEAGEVDAVVSGVTMTPERNLSFAFAGPYFMSGTSAVTNSAELVAAGAHALNDPDITLAVQKGTTSETLVRSRMPAARLVAVETYDEAMARVLARTADAMIADYPVCVVHWARNAKAGLHMWDQPLTVEPIGVALRADDALFLNLVQNFLASLEESGFLDQMRDRWFKDTSWARRLP